MRTVALNPLPKKLKSCFTCSLLLLAAGGLLASGSVLAADMSKPPPAGSQTRDADRKPQQQPPALPSDDAHPSDDSRNLPKPEVRIIHEKDKTVEEYRVGGVLRYIKIIPRHGKPYYLVDKDGDGIPETYYGPFSGPPPINQWLLLKW